MKTKIICTIGPASNNKDTIKHLLEAGMSVARVNFSHESHNEILRKINLIRKTAKEINKNVKILGDLQGPKIRIGYLKTHSARLKEGNGFIITTDKIIGNSKIAGVDYKDLHKYAAKNDRIFLDDGKIELNVKKINARKIHCEVVIGGRLTSRKGLTVLNKRLPLEGITKQDVLDLEFGAKVDIDWFAQSFVRKAEHINHIKEILKRYNADKNFVVAKIEEREGFKNIDEIISVSDGIMVARGDLGVTVDRALVPLIQRQIIKKCNAKNKTDIVATQMLDSMIDHPYPTRAEVSDVAVAVMEKADYLLLSAETAIGKYPVKATKEMARIISVIEKNIKCY